MIFHEIVQLNAFLKRFIVYQNLLYHLRICKIGTNDPKRQNGIQFFFLK